MAVVFRTQRRVEFSDTDMAGIVHFARFFVFMEHAEQEFLRSLGLSVSMEWEGQRIGLPRVSAHCDYVSQVTFEDVMDVEIEVEKLGTKSITWLFHFSKNGKTVARGSTTACCCAKNTERQLVSIPIPASFKARIEAVMGK